MSDSGWFLDREPYIPNAITTSEVVRQGWKLWDGVVPEACRKRHLAEPWRCYFGHRVYPTLRCKFSWLNGLFDWSLTKHCYYFCSSTLHLPVAVRRSSDASGQCRCTGDKAAMGLYSPNGGCPQKILGQCNRRLCTVMHWTFRIRQARVDEH